MKQLKIEYRNAVYIDCEIEDGLFFYGGNHEVKSDIIRTLRRFENKHTLTEAEKAIYGENGLEIYLDGNVLKRKDIDMYFIEDQNSFSQQFAYSKGTLLYDQLNDLATDFELNQKLYQLNNGLLDIEAYLNQLLLKRSDNISLRMADISLENLLKSNLNLVYTDQLQEYPLHFMHVGSLVDEWLNLISERIRISGRPVWVTLLNLNTYFSASEQQTLIAGLKKISLETGLLYFLVFCNEPLNITYDLSDIKRTVLLYSTHQQLPEFLIFKESIARNYPGSFRWSDEEVVTHFFKVCQFVGKNVDMTCFSGKSVVLLKVLKAVLADETSVVFHPIKLSEMEYSYLKTPFNF